MQILLRMIATIALIGACTAGSLFAAGLDESGQLPGQLSEAPVSAKTRDEALINKLEETESSAKTPAVVLRSEPGDGLVKLNWVLPQGTGQAIRFSVRFGTESEKYTTLAVGSGTEYVLRGLKNFVPYFIQVVALDRDQKMLFKSEEIQVIPLPLEARSSQIELAFSRNLSEARSSQIELASTRNLKQFGYVFFKNSLLLTSAIDAMPVGSNYILGPGDVVNLTVWGATNLRQELTVDRNGELLIPKVGPVRVWGLPFDKAKTAVSEAMDRYYRNYEMSLTLGKLRTIQVYVVGEVEAPGNYPVSSLATVINALAMAGGPSHNGSLRGIRVTRGGQTLATVDLYDMLLSGDRNKDVQLQNGDTIFVPVIGSVVAVAGEVRRPAIFELNGRTTVSDILKMAGGVAASGSLERFQIERLENNARRIVLDIVPKAGSLEAELGGVELKDRDIVKVFPIRDVIRHSVELKGNVQQAGEYQFRPGMRLTDLIPSMQVLLPETHLDSVEIVRISPPDYQKELIHVNLRRALAGNQGDNMLLQEQDVVRVFSRWEMEEKPRVTVEGAVMKPGEFDYFPGMSVRDLLMAAGSTKRNALLDQAELTRIVITGDKVHSSRIQIDLGKALAGDAVNNLTLQSDDILMVRSVSDWQNKADKYVTINGEVRFPGKYSLTSGEKLYSVIARAGGYTDKAYLRGAKFTRRSVRELQQKRMDEIIVKTEKELLQKQSSLAAVSSSREELDSTKAALDALMKNVEQMKSLKAEGRVVIRLSAVATSKQSGYDLVLEGGDELNIPAHPGVVNVLGQVYNPNSYVYQEGLDVDRYLQKSGGPDSNAEASEMYIVRADGSVFSRQQSSFGIQWNDEGRSWGFGSFLSSSLEAGDTLVVPQKLDRIAWTREVKDWTQILANIALTAGTVLLGLR